jgi:flagellar protein FlbB
MASGAGSRIFILLLLVLVLLFGGSIWFDFLGIIDIKSTIGPVMAFIGIEPRTQIEDTDTPYLLEEERLMKLEEEVRLHAEELDLRAAELLELENEINNKIGQLEERENSLEEQEKSFNESVRMYDNRKANLEQNSQYLVGMPPNNAVDILVQMDDQDVIDLLRVSEQLAAAAGEDSIVSYWLSLMPAERAAVIQRKMAIKPSG